MLQSWCQKWIKFCRNTVKTCLSLIQAYLNACIFVGVAIGNRIRYVNNKQLIFYYTLCNIVPLARNNLAWFRWGAWTLACAKCAAYFEWRYLLVLLWWEIAARCTLHVREKKIARLFNTVSPTEYKGFLHTSSVLFCFLRDKIYCYVNTTNDCIIALVLIAVEPNPRYVVRSNRFSTWISCIILCMFCVLFDATTYNAQ